MSKEIPTFTMRQLLEAGVHFGHTTRRWNPKMGPYIFGERNGIHILNLDETVPCLSRALETLYDVAASGGRILFVGTKRQAQEIVADAAHRSGQYYVNHRWLGGMMTNWGTITKSIKSLKDLTKQLESDNSGLTKKELLGIQRKHAKLERALGGIKDMGARPDLVVVMDTNQDHIAVEESQKLGIPVIAILDSNSDPDGISFPIPGNDDALRSLTLYCDLFAGAILGGLKRSLRGAGVDVGAAIEAPVEIVQEVKKEESVDTSAPVEAPVETAPEAKKEEKAAGNQG